jgi:hypothetical protein
VPQGVVVCLCTGGIKLDIMKKIFFSIVTSIIVLGSLFIVQCNKNDTTFLEEKDQTEEIKSISDEVAVVGSFSSGSPKITISEQALDSLYQWYYASLEIEVNF